MKTLPVKRCPLSKLNSFDQNFIKLGHIVMNHSVFLIQGQKWSISQHAFRSYDPLFTKNHRLKQCPLYKLNSLDQNFMKLGHIVKYHIVFSKFDNGLYSTMPAGVIVVQSCKVVQSSIKYKHFFCAPSLSLPVKKFTKIRRI